MGQSYCYQLTNQVNSEYWYILDMQNSCLYFTNSCWIPLHPYTLLVATLNSKQKSQVNSIKNSQFLWGQLVAHTANLVWKPEQKLVAADKKAEVEQIALGNHRRNIHCYKVMFFWLGNFKMYELQFPAFPSNEYF